MKVYLDVDGVLADFTMGVHRKLGIELDYNTWPYRKGPEGWNWNKELGMTFDQFSEVCDFDLWAGLPWTLDGQGILRVILEFVEQRDIMLLTTPMPNVMSASGKVAWVRKNLPAYEHQMLICPGSKADSGLPLVPDSVLIDDNQDNVRKWRSAGGKAVNVPRQWNDLWPESMNAPYVVCMQLEEILRAEY